MLQEFARNIRILIVEDQPLAQNYLKYSLENLGFGSLIFAERAQDAINHCKDNKFELILCSFNLAKGKDGYQLYEELKSHKLIQSTTAFIFVSSETEPGLVHSVLELQPDDFLVKPFTLKELDSRITRVLLRKQKFKDVFAAIDRGLYDKALQLIEKHIDNPKFVKSIPQLSRIKGDILLTQKKYQQGQKFFISILQIQKLTWAKIGLIRCLIALDQEDKAFGQLQLLAQQPATKVEALELLSQIQFKRKDYNDALESIKKAASLSPRNINRQDRLVNIARINHDYESQYKASQDIVRYARNSMHDSPEIYLNAVRSGIDYALTNYNEEQTNRTLKQANDYISKLKHNFPQVNKQEQIDVINARIHYLKDEKEKAKYLVSELTRKEESEEDESEQAFNVEDELDKAKSFHELGFYQQSSELFERIDQHCQEQLDANPSIAAYIHQEKKQRKDIKSGPKELNSAAVNFYQRGNYPEAYKAFKQAFMLMPGNSSIALNLLQTICNNHQLDLDNPDVEQTINKCITTINNAELEKDKNERFIALKEKLGLFEEEEDKNEESGE